MPALAADIPMDELSAPEPEEPAPVPAMPTLSGRPPAAPLGAAALGPVLPAAAVPDAPACIPDRCISWTTPFSEVDVAPAPEAAFVGLCWHTAPFIIVPAGQPDAQAFSTAASRPAISDTSPALAAAVPLVVTLHGDTGNPPSMMFLSTRLLRTTLYAYNYRTERNPAPIIGWSRHS